MPRESRLDRIYSGLTALERAKLVLRTFHDQTREDPGWRLMMPQRQAAAFNGHIYTMNAANLYIAQMINGLDADLQLLWERWLRMITLAQWSQDVAGNAPSRPRVPQRAAQHAKGMSVRAGRQEELDEAVEVLAGSVRAGVSRLWTSMRAVEVGLEEMAASLDGTDPLNPTHRQRLQDVRKDLQELIESLEECDLAIERREPGEDLLQLMRGTVPAIRYMMG
jgi:hypothetical protein